MSSTINVFQLTNEGCKILFEEKQALHSYSEHLLFPAELTEFQEIKTDSRKIEFLGVRKLRSFCGLNSAIFYTTSGKPHLDASIEKEISISHSRNFCALALDSKAIGLDIEEVNDRILKVSSKFMNEDERAFIPSDDKTELTKLWCMKEAMFKLNSRSGIDFKSELLVKHQEGDTYVGQMLCEDGWKKVQMHCFQVGQLILCLCQFAVE